MPRGRNGPAIPRKVGLSPPYIAAGNNAPAVGRYPIIPTDSPVKVR